MKQKLPGRCSFWPEWPRLFLGVPSGRLPLFASACRFSRLSLRLRCPPKLFSSSRKSSISRWPHGCVRRWSRTSASRIAGRTHGFSHHSTHSRCSSHRSWTPRNYTPDSAPKFAATPTDSSHSTPECHLVSKLQTHPNSYSEIARR